MAFNNLRAGNTVYVLHKDVPSIEIGKITNVSIPVPKYGNGLDMVIDLTTETSHYQRLPANTDIADLGNSMVISCSKDAIINEIDYMKQTSLSIINSVEHHQNIVNSCEQMFKQLNPEIAEQEEEKRQLRQEINQLKDMVKELLSSLK